MYYYSAGVYDIYLSIDFQMYYSIFSVWMSCEYFESFQNIDIIQYNYYYSAGVYVETLKMSNSIYHMLTEKHPYKVFYIVNKRT